MRAAVVSAAALLAPLAPVCAQSAWCVGTVEPNDGLTVPPPISATATVTLFGNAPATPIKQAATATADKYTLYAGSHESLCRWPRPAPEKTAMAGFACKGGTTSMAQVCPEESGMPAINTAPAVVVGTMLVIAVAAAVVVSGW